MVRRASTVQSFHLIDNELGLDTAGGTAGRGSVPGAPADRGVLVIPDGVSRLVVDDDGPPRLRQRRSRRSNRAEYVLEPLRRGNDAGLLLLAPPDQPVKVNGEHVAHVICLRERDVVQVGRWTLHVAVYVQAEIGIAPDEYAGRKCIVCRTDVARKNVYLCVCGAVMHCDRTGGEEAIDCVLSTDCPGCRAPIRFDGYGDLPEGMEI